MQIGERGPHEGGSILHLWPRLWRKLRERFRSAPSVLHRRAPYWTSDETSARRTHGVRSLQTGCVQVFIRMFRAHLVLPKLTRPLKAVGSRSRRVFLPIAFFARMLFLCLVDATGREPRSSAIRKGRSAMLLEAGKAASLAVLKDQLDAACGRNRKIAESTEVNRQRAIVLQHCRDAAQQAQGFFR